MLRTAEGWHPTDIRTATHKRGASLTSLASANGLSESACRVALKRRGNFAEQVIARFVEVPAHKLWPHRYDDGRPLHLYIRVKPSRSVLSGHGQKRVAP